MPHKCDVCGSAFNRRDKLIKHIQLIHMDKKFPCDICGKEYSEQGSLRKHRRKYHKGLPKPQNRKQKKFDLPVGITSQRAWYDTNIPTLESLVFSTIFVWIWNISKKYELFCPKSQKMSF